MVISMTDIYWIFMILTRTGTFLFSIPFFDNQRIPTVVKSALSITLAIILFPFIANKGILPNQPIALFLCLLKEILAGAIMAFSIKILFAIIEFAGQIISISIGITQSQSFDPITQKNNPTLSTLLFYLTVILFFILNIHQKVILGICRSYDYVPIGLTLKGFNGIDTIVKGTSQIFLIGLQMAAPLLALDFVINLSFAVLGKAAPKINVFMISFAVKILLGFFLLLLIVELLTRYIYDQLTIIPEQILRCLVNI